ncbi:MAG: MAPEG family protein [Polyangiales bacterium]
MPSSTPIIAPVVALAVWTHVMWAWMYVTRVPAIRSSKMVLDPTAPRGEQMASLPAKVRWKADNYNHLMEQPTVFYAVALALAVLGQGAGTNATLAWVYVALRVVHSVLQATVNKIEIRFALFAVSSLVLIALTLNAVRAVF